MMKPYGSPMKPLNMDADGSYRLAQRAFQEAVAETAYLTGLDMNTIAAQALIASCIDQMLQPRYVGAFQALLKRAEDAEP